MYTFHVLHQTLTRIHFLLVVTTLRPVEMKIVVIAISFKSFNKRFVWYSSTKHFVYSLMKNTDRMSKERQKFLSGGCWQNNIRDMQN